MSKNNGGFFLGAIFGAAVAGVTALLYAPKSGEELREDLRDEFEDWLDRANDYKDYAYERGMEFYDAAAEATDDIKVNLKYSADQLKSQLEDVTHEAKHEMNRMKDEFSKSKDKLVEKGSEVVDTTKGELGAFGEVVKEETANITNQAQESAQEVEETVEEAKDNL